MVYQANSNPAVAPFVAIGVTMDAYITKSGSRANVRESSD